MGVGATVWAETWRRVGGTKKNFADLNDTFSGKNFNFHAEKPLFRKRIPLIAPFFLTLFVLSRASDNTTSLNIWGDQCMGRPPSNFGGDRPPVPPRSPPLGNSNRYLVL